MLGPELVIQLPDIGQGGGRGTFFVRSAEAYDLLVELVWEVQKLEHVKYVQWYDLILEMQE